MHSFCSKQWIWTCCIVQWSEYDFVQNKYFTLLSSKYFVHVGTLSNKKGRYGATFLKTCVYISSVKCPAISKRLVKDINRWWYPIGTTNTEFVLTPLGTVATIIKDSLHLIWILWKVFYCHRITFQGFKADTKKFPFHGMVENILGAYIWSYFFINPSTW